MGAKLPRNITRFLYPQVPLRALPRLVALTLFGGLAAGLYGILHDQVTYTLSPEYFTRFKFDQFEYADLNLGNRAFAGTIGFLATYWIGLMAGWVFGRLSIHSPGTQPEPIRVMLAFAMMLGTCIVFGFAGYIYGTLTWERSVEAWSDWAGGFLVEDVGAFARVGHIHNMSYVGGVIGSIAAGIWIRKSQR